MVRKKWINGEYIVQTVLRVLTLDFVTHLFVHVAAQIANYNIQDDVDMLIVFELLCIMLKISMLLGNQGVSWFFSQLHSNTRDALSCTVKHEASHF